MTWTKATMLIGFQIGLIIFFYHGIDFEPDLGEVLECLALMDTGPEFEYSEWIINSPKSVTYQAGLKRIT